MHVMFVRDLVLIVCLVVGLFITRWRFLLYSVVIVFVNFSFSFLIRKDLLI